MRRGNGISRLDLEFVGHIPDVLKDGTLYISMGYATAIHKCACGCGHEIVTPLSPIDWTLTFDGVSVTLDPSIGNWSYSCQSHYLIIKNRIVWSDRWSKSRIQRNRQEYRELVEQIDADRLAKEPSIIPRGVSSLKRGFTRLVQQIRKQR